MRRIKRFFSYRRVGICVWDHVYTSFILVEHQAFGSIVFCYLLQSNKRLGVSQNKEIDNNSERSEQDGKILSTKGCYEGSVEAMRVSAFPVTAYILALLIYDSNPQA